MLRAFDEEHAATHIQHCWLRARSRRLDDLWVVIYESASQQVANTVTGPETAQSPVTRCLACARLVSLNKNPLSHRCYNDRQRGSRRGWEKSTLLNSTGSSGLASDETGRVVRSSIAFVIIEHPSPFRTMRPCGDKSMRPRRS